MVAVEPFFSGSALDWNLSCFSNFSVAGDMNVNMSSCLLNLDVICTTDHVVGFTRPSHSVFAHSKRQKQEVGKACVRAEGILEVDLQSHELGIIRMKQRKNEVDSV